MPCSSQRRRTSAITARPSPWRCQSGCVREDVQVQCGSAGRCSRNDGPSTASRAWTSAGTRAQCPQLGPERLGHGGHLRGSPRGERHAVLGRPHLAELGPQPQDQALDAAARGRLVRGVVGEDPAHQRSRANARDAVRARRSRSAGRRVAPWPHRPSGSRAGGAARRLLGDGGLLHRCSRRLRGRLLDGLLGRRLLRARRLRGGGLGRGGLGDRRSGRLLRRGRLPDRRLLRHGRLVGGRLFAPPSRWPCRWPCRWPSRGQPWRVQQPSRPTSPRAARPTLGEGLLGCLLHRCRRVGDHRRRGPAGRLLGDPGRTGRSHGCGRRRTGRRGGRLRSRRSAGARPLRRFFVAAGAGAAGAAVSAPEAAARDAFVAGRAGSASPRAAAAAFPRARAGTRPGLSGRSLSGGGRRSGRGTPAGTPATACALLRSPVGRRRHAASASASASSSEDSAWACGLVRRSPAAGDPGTANSMPRRAASKPRTTNSWSSPRLTISLAARGGGTDTPDRGRSSVPHRRGRRTRGTSSCRSAR